MTKTQAQHGQPAVYNVTAPVLVDGGGSALNVDVSGNLNSTLATKIAGEDLNNDRLKVEFRNTNVHCTADTQVTTGGGILHSIAISGTTATPTAGLITVYDNTAESGTILYREWVFATVVGHSVSLDCQFTNGIYVGYDAAVTNVNVAVNFRTGL